MSGTNDDEGVFSRPASGEPDRSTRRSAAARNVAPRQDTFPADMPMSGAELPPVPTENRASRQSSAVKRPSNDDGPGSWRGTYSNESPALRSARDSQPANMQPSAGFGAAAPGVQGRPPEPDQRPADPSRRFGQEPTGTYPAPTPSFGGPSAPSYDPGPAPSFGGPSAPSYDPGPGPSHGGPSAPSFDPAPGPSFDGVAEPGRPPTAPFNSDGRRPIGGERNPVPDMAGATTGYGDARRPGAAGRPGADPDRMSSFGPRGRAQLPGSDDPASFIPERTGTRWGPILGGLGVLLLIAAAGGYYFLNRGPDNSDLITADNAVTDPADGAAGSIADSIDPNAPSDAGGSEVSVPAAVDNAPTYSSPTLVFSEAEAGPLSTNTPYDVTLGGVSDGATVSVVVDEIEQTSDSGPIVGPRLPKLLFPAGRHSLQVRTTEPGASIVDSNTIEVYVLGDAPEEGYTANLASVDIMNEGWSEALRRLDEYRAAGHERVQLLPLTPGYWNIFVPGLGEEQSGVEEYCEKFDLAFPDACFARYFNEGDYVAQEGSGGTTAPTTSDGDSAATGDGAAGGSGTDDMNSTDTSGSDGSSTGGDPASGSDS